MSTFDQRKAAFFSSVSPKNGVTGVTGVTPSQVTDFSAENLLHLSVGKVLQGVTAERVFERFALRYARKGFEIFPLARGSKKPQHGSHGLADATSDIAQVGEWCREFPYANIGLRTGPGSGICAIDLDPLKGGFESERRLRSEGKAWPQTAVQRTRSGGQHIILQYHPLILTGSNRLGPGIDFRGSGGYIVAAPSIVEGRRYSWLSWPPNGPAPAPAWLIDHLEAEAARRRADMQAAPKSNPVALDEPDYDRVRRALTFILSDDRQTWVNVGNALKTAFGEGGRSLWDLWSRGSHKFNARDQDKIWKSLKPGCVNIGYIFNIRRQYCGCSPICRL